MASREALTQALEAQLASINDATAENLAGFSWRVDAISLNERSGLDRLSQLHRL